MLKDNPFVKGLSSVCTGEEGKEGRGEKQWAKGKLSDLLKGTRSLQGQQGWAQRWMPALGLCAKKMPSLIIRKMCVWHQKVKHSFPFKTEKKALVAAGLGCTESSELNQLPQKGASRKVLFLHGGKHWKRKLFPYRGFLCGGDTSSSCCRVDKPQQENQGG